MSRCERCNGTILGEACILCGHDNLPILTLAELKEREKVTPMTFPHEPPPRRGRKPSDAKKYKPSKIPAIDRLGIYPRVLDALVRRVGPFTSSDIAGELGISSFHASRCLLRACNIGRARKVGMLVWVDSMGHTHGNVVQWEAVRERQEMAS